MATATRDLSGSGRIVSFRKIVMQPPFRVPRVLLRRGWQGHARFQAGKLVRHREQQRLKLLPKENDGKGEPHSGAARSCSLSEGTRYLDRAKWLSFDPVGITVHDQQGRTKPGTVRRVAEVAKQVSLPFAGDLMDAADFHRCIVKKQLSLQLMDSWGRGKVCEKPVHEGRYGLDIAVPLHQQHQAVHSRTSSSCPGSRAGSTVSSSPGCRRRSRSDSICSGATGPIRVSILSMSTTRSDSAGK